MDQEVNLKLPVKDLDTILAALASMPYVKVFELINKIHAQAQAELGRSTDTDTENTTKEE